MFPNWVGLLCAVLALTLFAIAYRRAVAMPPHRRWRWFALTTALSLPAGYNALYYLHWLPEVAWFYEIRSWRGVEGFVIPVGAAAGVGAALLRRRMLVFLLLVAVLVTFGPFLKPLIAPVNEAALRDLWKRGACMQSTPSSCGPASTATVLAFLDVPAREAEIVRAAHTYAGGTEAWYLARYIRSRGLGARFVTTRDRFPGEAVRLPSIVGVIIGGRGHFIAMTARNNDSFDIADPMLGPETLTRAALEQRYEFTGFAMEVSPAHARRPMATPRD